MRRVGLYMLVVFFSLCSTISAHNDDDCCHSFGDLNCIDHVSIDYHRGSVFINPKYDDEEGEVEITRDYELYVNGKKVELNDEQQDWVMDYHELVRDIYREAMDIGWEGAKIGVKGAALGLKAVVGVVRLLSPDYDEEDLERDLEYEAEKIEIEAEELEEFAEEIEEMAEDLEYTHKLMRREIKQLDRLRWF